MCCRPQYECKNVKRKKNRMNNAPSVSIIMPSLNVERFYRQCIESVINQTLKDIEIICVDAGSTDGTLEILQEYAEKDPRIVIIHSDKKSYGYQMNLGLDRARGEYIGIVETDDWVDPDMFSSLYSMAKDKNVDFVRSNYYWYWTDGDRSDYFENLKNCRYEEVFEPVRQKEIFTATPAIWSAIYRRSMLIEEGIRFNETPGASFQDTSFHFMVCTVAKSCFLSKKAFLHYRKDNGNSSVFSKSKTFCICDEMHYFESFLEQHLTQKACISKFYTALKYEKYRWNFSRLDPGEQQKFLPVMYEEFTRAKNANLLDECEFTPEAWQQVNLLISKPIRYYSTFCRVFRERSEVFHYFVPQVMKESAIESPSVTVIIPAYNAEKYVRQTLDSVLKSPSELFEIVAVNDGSDDKTLDILLEYAGKDTHITVINQINKGQGASRNTALGYAKGKYIIFLDSDDLLGDGAVENLHKIAEERNLDVLYYNGQSFFESAQLEAKYPFYKTAYQYCADLPDAMSGPALYCRMKKDKGYSVSPCLGMYRKEYLNQKGIRFLEGVYHEDNLFSMQSMVLADRVAHINEKYLLRRVHSDSIMTSQKEFLHFYGYLQTALEEQAFCYSIPFSEELYGYIAGELKGLTSLLKKTFDSLESQDEAMRKLTPIERFNAEMLLQTNHSQNIVSKDCVRITRKARKVVQCYKENGIKYTIRRILTRLHLMK